jgi:hypothetical protein
MDQSNTHKPWLFKPGQSGNPGGRVKGVEARARAIIDLEECMSYLASVVRNDSKREATKDRIVAAKLCLERGYGMSRQVVTVEQEAPDEFRPETLTREERDELERLLAVATGDAFTPRGES